MRWRRRLCEQIFVLSQERQQRLWWLVREVFERLGDVIEGLMFWGAGAQVAPRWVRCSTATALTPTVEAALAH